MSIAYETLIESKNVLVARVEALTAPHILRANDWRVIPQQLLAKWNSCEDESISGVIIAVIVRQVIIDLPEHVLGDATEVGLDAVIGLSEKVSEIIELQEFGKHSVTQAIALDKGVQFLKLSDDVDHNELDDGLPRHR